jgi:hypothetical protein
MVVVGETQKITLFGEGGFLLKVRGNMIFYQNTETLEATPC